MKGETSDQRNQITEAEAMEKICHKTRLLPPPANDRPCLGKRCMAWLWTASSNHTRYGRCGDLTKVDD